MGSGRAVEACELILGCLHHKQCQCKLLPLSLTQVRGQLCLQALD